MLRIIYSIVIILTTALTFILGGDIGIADWQKYTPPAGVVLLVIVLWIITSASSSDRKNPTLNPPSQSLKEPPEDVGILEIKPISSTPPTVDLTKDLFTYKDEPTTIDTPTSIQLSLLTESELQDPLSTNSFVKYDPLNKNILIPILQGFRIALNAHAVGIIQDMGNYEYKVLGTVGQDWIRSRGDVFVLKYDLLDESQLTEICLVGSDGLQSNHLTYSRKPASITAIGITAIGNTGNYLLVDTIDEGGLTHPRAKELLEIFGHTYQLLLYKDDPDRPRHEIILEEMNTAREKNKELAFALVVPQRAELLIKTYGDFIDEIEGGLEDCLTRATKEGRVIKFGEIIFGVFTNGNKKSLELWHQDLQNEIKSHGGLLTGGVFIGIAIMKKEHSTSDDLRNEARHALMEAYQGTTETVII